MKCPVLRSLPRPTISLDSDLREYRTGGSRCPEEEIPNPGPRHVIGHAPHMAVIARPRHPQQLDGGFDSQTCLDPRRFHCGPGWLHIFDSFLKKRISTACSPITVCNSSIFRSSASCWLRCRPAATFSNVRARPSRPRRTVPSIGAATRRTPCGFEQSVRSTLLPGASPEQLCSASRRSSDSVSAWSPRPAVMNPIHSSRTTWMEGPPR